MTDWLTDWRTDWSTDLTVWLTDWMTDLLTVALPLHWNKKKLQSKLQMFSFGASRILPAPTEDCVTNISNASTGYTWVILDDVSERLQGHDTSIQSFLVFLEIQLRGRDCHHWVKVLGTKKYNRMKKRSTLTTSLRRCGGLMVNALDSRSSGLGSSPGLDHCVVFLGKTRNSHSASLHWRNRRNALGGVTCDGLASPTGGVVIPLVALCYGNWDKLQN